MRSRWHRGEAADNQHAPVEMRFIDMFMTALGSLVFVAMLLVFLLPKTAQQIDDDNQIKKRLDALVAENQRLKQQIPQAPSTGGADANDKNIVKRWFSVVLVANGCDGSEPELYVRWEGKVSNFDTGEPLPDPEPFDASDVNKKTVLIGSRYFDVGYGAEGDWSSTAVLNERASLGLTDLQKAGLHTKVFYTATRAPGLFSVYAGFRQPRTQGDRKCIIAPIYLSSQGLIPGEKIVMNQQRPFAWLRRFSIRGDGTTSLGTSPRFDEQFKRDLTEFSSKQSQILCEKKALCDTTDAHYALLFPPRAAKPLSMEEEGALNPKDVFRECDKCPEMVVVPKGSFLMGSPESEAQRGDEEGPQHQVTFARQFAAGRFAVTFEEWDACVADGGCDAYRPRDQGWGRGLEPVINVSWTDARAYVEWLRRKTGREYRLLSEAEREYVSRAGTTTPFWTGATILPSQANYDATFVYAGGVTGEYRRRTMPVDSFASNPWGLYQINGNVEEWAEDCQNRRYQGAPIDGSARTQGNCTYRAVRGGSWFDSPISLRSSFRSWRTVDTRSDTLGFRVARTLSGDMKK